MLILASTSPRRRELLTAAGIAFEVREPIADETRHAGESPIDYVVRVACEKANSIRAAPGDIVLGADTIVCVVGEVLGKPRNRDDARRMLRSLSGRSHWVYTGFCLVLDSRTISDSVATEVVMDELSNAEIDEYVESGEPLDDNFRSMASDEIERFRREIIERGGKLADEIKGGKELDDATLLREVMNTVGKQGQLGGSIRCVVSVSDPA